MKAFGVSVAALVFLLGGMLPACGDDDDDGAGATGGQANSGGSMGTGHQAGAGARDSEGGDTNVGAAGEATAGAAGEANAAGAGGESSAGAPNGGAAGDVSAGGSAGDITDGSAGSDGEDDTAPQCDPLFGYAPARPDDDASEECRAYADCLEAGCGSSYSRCFGPNWEKGQYGGLCGPALECVRACDCDDTCSLGCLAVAIACVPCITELTGCYDACRAEAEACRATR
ncbi:MAG: hypothetical protein DIU78_017650 [Pseudomonadota bacterium]|nr:MAG: hypothetical protein DIU78_21440 [Pseudomonadota bacterium]